MIRLALAQYDFLVGDIAGNLEKIKTCAGQARQAGASLVLFPELALTGYPPEDLLLRPGFMRSVHEAMHSLAGYARDIELLVGHPHENSDGRFNAASWLRDGEVAGRYYKQALPNYAVFDEARYFSPGHLPLVIEHGGVQVGVVICEDAWESVPIEAARKAGAQLILIPNASPYRDDKQQDRNAMFRDRSSESGLPMVYCNLVGGQDELVFDGRSALVSGAGAMLAQGPLCEEALLLATFHSASGTLEADQWTPSQDDETGEIYAVLVCGLRDYVHKNGFSDVVLGLSGGVDSALTLALAVDALGAVHVHAVMMPSRHTSELSLQLAGQQAGDTGVDYLSIPIETPFEAMMAGLESSFEGSEDGLAAENLQARLRGAIVMALSNEKGWLPLATGNKSELAVGYSTIYGDMCGGFSPIKDCLKTRVYELCRYRNTLGPAIPEAVIVRAPTAELAPGQLDQDSLPEYGVLDQVLHRFVDLDWSIHDIVADGYEESMVRRVAGMVLQNEYKRRQGAPGTRVTSRGFGRDRRYPITSGWREYSKRP